MNYAKMGLRHKDEATRDKALNKILDAANRAAKVTQTILGLARNRSGHREPTDLASVIRDTLVLLEREMVRYRIGIETELDNVPLRSQKGIRFNVFSSTCLRMLVKRSVNQARFGFD